MEQPEPTAVSDSSDHDEDGHLVILREFRGYIADNEYPLSRLCERLQAESNGSIQTKTIDSAEPYSTTLHCSFDTIWNFARRTIESADGVAAILEHMKACDKCMGVYDDALRALIRYPGISEHLPNDKLRLFAHKQLNGFEAFVVSLHLNPCDRCSAAVEQLRNPTPESQPNVDEPPDHEITGFGD